VNVIFAGTPDISISAMVHLAKTHNIMALICKPDFYSHRRKSLIAPKIKEVAISLGIPVLQPEKISEITNIYGAELLVCFAYGKIFPISFLEKFSRGAINFHPSLLPAWRGPSPMQASILSGDKITGFSVQYMAKDMDAGDILLQEKYELASDETYESLSFLASTLAGPMLLQVIQDIADNKHVGLAQNHNIATYCSFIKKENTIISFHDSAEHIDRLVRAMYPTPLAHTFWNDKKLFIAKTSINKRTDLSGEIGQVLAYDKLDGLLVQTGQDLLCISMLQVEGKKVLLHNEFINGNKSIVGTKLGLL
jgi:methionyl-tRNA formyltransferase